MDDPDDRGELVSQAGSRSRSFELEKRVLECFEDTKRFVEIKHQSEWNRIVAMPVRHRAGLVGELIGRNIFTPGDIKAS